MAERQAEEERLAAEKALRERRWRAAGHIQRFWQGYKVRKVNFNYYTFSVSTNMHMFDRVSKPKRKRKARVARKVAKNEHAHIFLYIISFLLSTCQKLITPNSNKRLT